MALTAEEEKILKLIAAEKRAKAKLDSIKQQMESDVAVAANTAADDVRASYFAVITPLKTEWETVRDSLITEAEK